MPGLNLIIYKNRKPESTGCPDGELIYSDDFIAISKNIPYAYYPVFHWETGNRIFVIEGYFFNWKDWRLKIEQFAEKLFNADHHTELTRHKFADVDAEFIGIIYDKSLHTTVIFNDVLARFSLYKSETEHFLIFSRNIKYIRSFISLSANKQAFLETLTFRFSLGSKTLYKEVERMPGGMIVEISGGNIKSQKYHEFNYEQMIIKDFDIHLELPEIEKLFNEAVKNRAGLGDLNIISISGGLDSRAVSAAFKNAGLECRLISFLDNEGGALNDIKYAKEIAAALAIPLEVVALPDPPITDYDLFFNEKYGLNGLDMAFLLDFFRHLANLSKQPVMFTGDGGDRILPDHLPPSYIRSASSAVDYILNTYAKINPGTAAMILGENKDALRSEILKELESYPEKNWRYKYVHFAMKDILTNLQFEGEDRNRCFLPSVTPFYSIPLLKKLMSAPQQVKRDHNLYREFLLRISPELSGIPNANWNFNIMKTRKIQWAYFKQGLKKTNLVRNLRSFMQKEDNCTNKKNTMERFIFDHLVVNENLSANFDVDYIKQLRYFNREDLFRIMTLNKAMNV